MRHSAAAVTLVLLALAACGGDIDQARTPAGAAQVRQIENLFDGNFDRAYFDLHPAQQRLVPKPLFLRCAPRSIAVGELASIEVLDAFDEDIRIPGVPERRARAVRVRVSSLSGDSYTSLEHEVKVGDRWRWVLNAAAINAYRQGICPGGAR